MGKQRRKSKRKEEGETREFDEALLLPGCLELAGLSVEDDYSSQGY